MDCLDQLLLETGQVQVADVSAFTVGAVPVFPDNPNDVSTNIDD
jgi:hypothetical protein